ncbi:hypothetical protein AYL99_09631 [Fonsecaea erecta]|uniref:G domain-containing protein n=1 Tax=Fonsecaea erecta TaxID=1367422 RepID=A0A178Z9V5_9EURO|nr:hypothetical protein AYL99_09631 [Fonsecaea erecta]OAP56452.1 hypothetical protein AYL99_09631 [Fonsecaea erecta]
MSQKSKHSRARKICVCYLPHLFLVYLPTTSALTTKKLSSPDASYRFLPGFITGLAMASAPCNIVQQTQYCLDQIRASNEPARVFLLLGRTGVGKSSLFEDLTGTEGHSRNSSDPVTTTFQLDEALINGQRYFFMDTPGFDAGDELQAFREIGRGIEAIRHHAAIVGVLYVTRINYSRIEHLDRKLLEFLGSFCGDRYIPRITFVTTHWTLSQGPYPVEEDKFVKLRSLWADFLTKGAKLYQHGQRYSDQGEDTGTCLSWDSQRREIAEHARGVVSRCYGEVNPGKPKIVEELGANIPLYRTAAAMALGLTTESPSAPSNEPGEKHSTQNWVPGESSRPRAPRETGETAGPSHSPGTGQTESGISWYNVGLDLLGAVLKNAQINMSVGGGATSCGTGGYRWPRSSFRGTGWDPNSSIDQFKRQGKPSDLAFRRAVGRERGIFNVGTREGNDSLLRSVRENPL